MTIPDIVMVVRALNFYHIRCSQHCGILASVTVFSILENIGRHHFRAVFKETTTFTTAVVLVNISLDILTRVDEDQISK